MLWMASMLPPLTSTLSLTLDAPRKDADKNAYIEQMYSYLSKIDTNRYR